MKTKKYDLSASRYRQVKQDDEFYEQPSITLERLRKLQAVSNSEIDTLQEMMAKS